MSKTNIGSDIRKYDVIIIGSGIAGIFAGYELVSGNKTLKVAIIEQGADI
ncbi:MAG: FAD-binding protein, partial [Eubacteriales bacterium]|nr:FAD-binding protein [Eubacteriales bacterium]